MTKKNEVKLDNGEKVVNLVTDYFKGMSTKIGNAAESFFTSDNFSAVIAMNLKNTNVVAKNREKVNGRKPSGQTAIAVTGNNCKLFFSQSFIDDTNSNSPDIMLPIDVSGTNIHNMGKYGKYTASEHKDLSIKNSVVDCYLNVRASGDKQVQLKKENTGEDFLDLRDVLYVGDFLLFFKYRGQNRLFAIGIPKSFHKENYGIVKNIGPLVLTQTDKVSAKTVLKQFAEDMDDDETVSVSSADEIDDMLYQQEVDNAGDDLEIEASDNAPEVYDASKDGRKNSSGRPKTDAKLGKKAICANDYKCFFDDGTGKHETFIKRNGKVYMEAHHLVPMKEQGRFEHKLDKISNIVPLCPCCHRQMHNGRLKEVKGMIHKIWVARENELKAADIDSLKDGTELDEATIVSFYK